MRTPDIGLPDVRLYSYMMNRNRYGLFACLALSFLITACAEKGPVLIKNVKYLVPEQVKAGTPKVIVGVSPFRDQRGMAPSLLGKRTIGNDIENELVVQGTVAELVTNAVRESLKARGITVKEAPGWDLGAEPAAGEGSDIIIGGEIKTLWIDVMSQPLNVKQKAEVSLRVSAASMPARTVFKTLTMNSKTDKQDAMFSWDSVESLLSESLTAAIEQFLKDDEFKKRIQ